MLASFSPYRVRLAAETTRGADETDAYEARLRSYATSSTAARLLSGFTAVAVFVFLLDVRAHLRTSHHERATMVLRIANAREVIAAAAAYAVTERARFTTALEQAISADASDAPLPLCEANGPLTSPASVVVLTGDGPTSPSLERVLEDAARAEGALASHRWSDGVRGAEDLALRLGSAATRPHYDVAVVTRAMHPPAVTSATTFEPGELDGRAYVYDFDTHRIRCAGDLRARSSSHVVYPRSPAGGALLSALVTDFEGQIERALATLLRAHKSERREPEADTDTR